MTDNLKRYPLMKVTNLPWVDQVPSHWELVPNRALLRKRKVLVGDRHTDYRLLSLTKSGVIVRDISTGRGKFSADMGTSQEVREGDLVFCLFDVPETPRTVGLSKHHGMITGAYTVFECKDNQLARFLEAFYIAMDDRKLLSPLYSGLRNTIPPPVLLGQKTPLPPAQEQAAIVRFLNHADRTIRCYIRAKQKLIKLLEEQKQVIIHRAVTRGLDPTVRLKPSGVEWLGDVPEHWEVVPLKRAFARMDYGISDSGSDSGVIPVLTMGHIRNGVVTVPERGGVSRVEQSLLLKDKDLLFNRTNSAELVAKVGLFRAVSRPVTVASYLVRMRSLAENSPEFLNLALNAPAFLGAARREAIPSLHQSNLNPTRYGRLPIPLPPTQEQIQIVDAVLEQTSSLNDTAASAWREIDLLHEYRTRLIADVVTGKLDVREAAAKLLDEDQELQPIDESDEISDAEEDGFDDLDDGTEESEP
jgi:type I restriction enzyme S subunit